MKRTRFFNKTLMNVCILRLRTLCCILSLQDIFICCHHILFSPYLVEKIREKVAELQKKDCKFVLLLAASRTYRANTECMKSKL